MKRILPKIYLQRGTNNWIYFAIGRWQPFAFFGASGWIAPSVKWLAVRFFSEVRRHCRMTRARFALPLILLLLCAPLAGCPSPSKDAVLINGAGAIAASILNLDGLTDAAQKALKTSSQLATDIQNFVPGSSTQNIVQLGNDFIAILQADSNSKAAEEIGIIGTTILNVISDYDQPTPTPSFAVAAAASYPAKTMGPRTKAEFNAAINAALAAHPVAGLKKLK